MVNKSLKHIDVSLKLENLPGEIKVAGGKSIPLPQEAQGSGSFFVVLPKSVIKDRKTEIKVGIYDHGKKIDVKSSNFLGPIHVN